MSMYDTVRRSSEWTPNCPRTLFSAWTERAMSSAIRIPMWSRLYATLAQSDRQVCYYHPGLGTRGDPNALTKLAKVWTQADRPGLRLRPERRVWPMRTPLSWPSTSPATGCSSSVSAAAPITARALCGMLYMFGLLRTHQEALIYYMIRMMGKADDKKMYRIAEQFQDTFSRKCPIYFLGVWDTVSSVGWVYSPVIIPFTQNNPDIHIARHAISLDERRAFYRQNLLGDPGPGQDFQQEWFPGVHSDVGGSYPESESGLSKISLQVDAGRGARGRLGVERGQSGRDAGRDGPLLCSRESGGDAAYLTLRGMVGAGVLPEEALVSRMREANGSVSGNCRWRGRERLPAGAVFHPSVEERRELVPEYQPVNLPAGTAVRLPVLGEAEAGGNSDHRGGGDGIPGVSRAEVARQQLPRVRDPRGWRARQGRGNARCGAAVWRPRRRGMSRTFRSGHSPRCDW